ncbi:MAG: hypothetical protein OEV52_04210 [Dehalococcoidia bacterium]|nr:hypothetical protein [Dehalococcoidia bacterium]
MKTLSTFVIAVALIVGLAGCTAEPTPTQYTLTISSTEGGEVPTPGDGTSTYEKGTEIILLALPHTGYRFVNWTGDVGTVANVNSASTTITMNDDYSITANFVTTPESAPPIPGQYQAIYDELKAEMAHFEVTINETWNHSLGQTIIATELAYANGNIGEGLLSANIMNYNRMLLDSLQAMGVKGVVLAIKFPLLKPDFPRSSEYLQFFKNIMVECHQRSLKVLVECGAIFAGTPYSPIEIDWSNYTTETFLQGLEDQLLLIAEEIKPDYLTLANEPQTQEALTKLTITPAVWSDFIASTLQNIDRSGGLLVGAGTGTWENPNYINELFNMPDLDYIDLHIYPMNRNAIYLDRALNYAIEARAAGKHVTVSESWLWKATPAELSNFVGDTEKIMNRDVYSFWYPLDERFIQDIMNLADATDMDFVSFFWTRNLLSYLDYDSTPHNLTTAEYNRLINQASLANLQKGELSPLGQYLQQALNSRTNS